MLREQIPLTLSTQFRNHAVLQRERPLSIRGCTAPYRIVHGTIGTSTAAARSDESGRFTLRFPPQPGSTLPQTLTVKEMRSGKTVTAENLLFGEVWLAGGQSNMELPLRELPERLAEAQALLKSTPKIRMLNVGKCAETGGRDEITGSWSIPTPETIGNWSAVGFFFAAKLSAELNVPVGIISSNWGATNLEAWSTRASLLQYPETAKMLAEYDEAASRPEVWETLINDNSGAKARAFDPVLARLKELEQNPPADRKRAQDWAHPAFDDSAWKTAELPGLWKTFGFRSNGVLWFRRTIKLPAEWRGRALTLEIGAADKHDVTYFNGTEVGRTGTGVDSNVYALIRSYPVPASLTADENAVIAVRNYSFIYDGGLHGPSARMRLFPAGEPEKAVPLAGLWKYEVECDIGNTLALRTYGRGNPCSPSILFENMIRPLAGLSLRGVIFYQGESNTGIPTDYEGLMKNLIADWRNLFENPHLPFLQVLLAGYHEPSPFDPSSEWARIRFAQLRAAEENLCATALDLGESANIHPARKREVGERLAAATLTQAYGRSGDGCGPVFSHCKRNGNILEVTFRHCSGGLRSEGELRGFHALYADGKRETLTGTVSGRTVRLNLTSAKPFTLYYAWSDNPSEANLRGANGLPAAPFRVETGK